MNLRESTSTGELNRLSADSAASHTGIRVEAIGEDWVQASMPIDERTCGLDGALQLGALAILAETVGSIASAISVDREKYLCMGQTLQVYHLARASAGPVLAKATPVEIGDDRQIWQIDILDAQNTAVANATLTTVILEKKADA